MSARRRRLRVSYAALALAGAACARGPETRADDSAAVESAAATPPAGPVTPAPVTETPRATDTTAPSPPPAPTTTSDSVRRARTSPPRPAPTPLPAEDVMVGEVVAGGSAADPVTSLRVEGRGPMTLVGPLEAELRRLGGATVSVAGGLASAPPDAFSVARYEIVSVDGARPSVGTLVGRDGGVWLEGADTVRLLSVPAALQGRSGAKVWVVGRRTGAELTVQSYGVLKDP